MRTPPPFFWTYESIPRGWAIVFSAYRNNWGQSQTPVEFVWTTRTDQGLGHKGEWLIRSADPFFRSPRRGNANKVS